MKGLVRPGRAGAVPRKVEADRGGDARRGGRGGARLRRGAQRASIPSITEWRKNALSLAYAAIAAAESNGATLMFPGSVWNYGRDMPPVLDESTPMQPTTRKGGMRVEIEQRIQEACDRGMRAIILRAGDFFGAGRGSWFDLVIAKDIGAQPPHLSRPARRRARLGLPARFRRDAGAARGAARQVRPARELRISRPCGDGGRIDRRDRGGHQEQIQRRPMSWWMLKTFGQLLALGRELSELEYLWRVPHRISGDKLKAAIGDIPHTPLPQAIAASLRAHRLTPRRVD